MHGITPVVAQYQRARSGLAGLTGLVFLATVLAVGAIGPTYARTPSPLYASEAIGLAELPRQGQQVYGLIQQGGPFVSEKDGTVFGNRERLLPANKRGFYREYTVPTPGLKHRGARRIVCGGQPRQPDVCYYTADHYESFRKIVP